MWVNVAANKNVRGCGGLWRALNTQDTLYYLHTCTRTQVWKIASWCLRQWAEEGDFGYRDSATMLITECHQLQHELYCASKTDYLPNNPCPRPLSREKEKKERNTSFADSHTSAETVWKLHSWRPTERVSCVLAALKQCPRIELLLEKLSWFRSSSLPLVLRFHFDVCSLIGSQAEADTEPRSPKLISPQKQSLFD